MRRKRKFIEKCPLNLKISSAKGSKNLVPRTSRLGGGTLAPAPPVPSPVYALDWGSFKISVTRAYEGGENRPPPPRNPLV